MKKQLENKTLVHLFFFYFLVSFPMDPTFPFPITFLLRCFISIWINGCRFSVAISFLSVVFHSLFSWGVMQLLRLIDNHRRAWILWAENVTSRRIEAPPTRSTNLNGLHCPTLKTRLC